MLKDNTNIIIFNVAQNQRFSKIRLFCNAITEIINMIIGTELLLITLLTALSKALLPMRTYNAAPKIEDIRIPYKKGTKPKTKPIPKLIKSKPLLKNCE